jgi:trehalose synthase-fused probable maltokinase
VDRDLPRWLPPFLVRQRWFGGKGRAIASCEIDDVARFDDDPDVQLVVCRVTYDGGSPERYALLLARRDDPAGLPVVGRLDPAGEGWIVEAAGDARAAGALLAGFGGTSGLRTHRGGRLEFGDATPAAAAALAGPISNVTPLGAEQSNTSLRIGRAFLFKLFRRIEPGENPEVEVGRFLLARTAFRAMPRLEGSITYRSPTGESSTVGVLQGWIENQGDGWTYVVEALEEAMVSGAPAVALQRDVGELGRTTARLHAALASDPASEAFRPEPVAPGDRAAWLDDVRVQAERSIAMLRANLPAWTGDALRLGEGVVARAARVAAVTSAVDMAAAPTFSRIRIHGDFHLGQTLKTAGGFVVIDFEGEPARPLARRRQKTSALKDVAGLLRSFAYAGETAGRRASDRIGRRPASVDLRTPFLAGFLDESSRLGAVSIPKEPQAIAAWLAVFELEKAFYELEYEINNRPAWAPIPLRGLLDLLAGAGGATTA